MGSCDVQLSGAPPVAQSLISLIQVQVLARAPENPNVNGPFSVARTDRRGFSFCAVSPRLDTLGRRGPVILSSMLLTRPRMATLQRHLMLWTHLVPDPIFIP
ncbi:uncharacterized protein ARMOST_07113 [Armillaria ostoyae]|uniref:Uncharacterized protein n=1 Tax=Armillaria ostoyae TaxID=47428 RepID=A0A284R4Y3_ARMOS|nr:uncharacterized protein ARMOST_07113 [Armillaria ostoyae]